MITSSPCGSTWRRGPLVPRDTEVQPLAYSTDNAVLSCANRKIPACQRVGANRTAVRSEYRPQTMSKMPKGDHCEFWCAWPHGNGGLASRTGPTVVQPLFENGNMVSTQVAWNKLLRQRSARHTLTPLPRNSCLWCAFLPTLSRQEALCAFWPTTTAIGFENSSACRFKENSATKAAAV